jgi:hypothetical protein
VRKYLEREREGERANDRREKKIRREYERRRYSYI